MSNSRFPYKQLFREQSVSYEVEDKDGETSVHSFMQVNLVYPEAVIAKPRKLESPLGEKKAHSKGDNSDDDAVELRFVAGNYVECSKTDQTFFATTTGYPGVERSQDNGVTIVTFFVTPLAWVAPDAMRAFLALRPPPPGSAPLEMNDILAVLDKERITFGRLTRQIQNALDTVNQQGKPVDITVAKGLKPQNGKDAKLLFKMEVGPIPGKKRGDGSIDFRERKMFVGVDQGELIAVKVSPTNGKPGKNIYGDELLPRPGEDIVVKVSDDAIFDPETNEIKAARAGVLSMVTEHSVKVCAKQVVSSDVDFTTGNIISRNTLEITGSVRPQFKVIAVGDITVGENVEKAILRSDANIIIKGGILGARSRVQARRDVDIGFLEHGRVVAHGNIILRRSAYYCRLHSQKDIFIPPEGKIIASQVVGAGSLLLGNVGAENADCAIIGAGIDLERLQMYYDYRRDCIRLQEEHDQLCRLVGVDSDFQALVEARKKYNAAKIRLNKLNIESGADHHESAVEQLCQQTITVHGTIYKGTEVRIGNSKVLLSVTMKKVRFYLSYEKRGGKDASFSQTIAVEHLENE